MIELLEQHRQDIITADESDDRRCFFRYMAVLTEAPRTGELALEFYRADNDR